MKEAAIKLQKGVKLNLFSSLGFMFGFMGLVLIIGVRVGSQCHY